MQSKMKRDVSGLLLFDKPTEFSSNQVLQKVKRIFAAEKAGHTGSLDPLASGLLPICLGEATKFSQFLLDSNKYYRVTAKLGERTTTCDQEGDVIESKSTEQIDLPMIQAVLKNFLGDQQQIPSMYSALKHEGKPLYKLARQGIEIDRQPRSIVIESIELLDWSTSQITLDVHCSKGTYIRNLVDDIGQTLGCGAYVSSLRRLGVGPFHQDQMVTFEMLEMMADQQGYNGLDSLLLPIEAMLEPLPALTISSHQAQALRFGKVCQLANQTIGLVSLFEENHRFIGVGEVTAEGLLRSKRLLKFNYSGQNMSCPGRDQ